MKSISSNSNNVHNTRTSSGDEVRSIASHSDILKVYQQQAIKSNDPGVQYEFCCFLFEQAEQMMLDPAKTDVRIRQMYVQEGLQWLKKLVWLIAKDDRQLQIQAESQFRLAELYRLGVFVQCDPGQAWKLYENAAKKNMAVACYRAGLCCEEGLGRKQSFSRALMFYRKAAGMIHYPSMFKLVTIYAYQAQEFGVLNSNEVNSSFEALKWLKIIATHATNNAEEKDIYALAALYELGMWYAEGTPASVKIPDFILDHEYAIELIYESGRRGYSPAAFKLGEIFEKGMYGVRYDYTSAIFWFRRILSFVPVPDSEFVTLDEWKRAAQRKIAYLEQRVTPVKTEITPKIRSYSITLMESGAIDDNSKRIITHLTQRKKLRRNSLPDPIRTGGLLRVKYEVRKQNSMPDIARRMSTADPIIQPSSSVANTVVVTRRSNLSIDTAATDDKAQLSRSLQQVKISDKGSHQSTPVVMKNLKQ